MRFIAFAFITLCVMGAALSQQTLKVIDITEDLQLIKLSEKSFVHKSFTNSEQFGRFSSNGYILINGGKAIVFDTPMSELHTEELIDFLHDSLKLKIEALVVNHWHNDCMGGISVFHKNSIKSYACNKTIEIALAKGLECPQIGFSDSLILDLESITIRNYYIGAAHSLDNIISWIPDEELLFAGCMIKSLNSTNLGNTKDGDLVAYPQTIKIVLDKYKNAKFVIPGHGSVGGYQLIEHTFKLASGTYKK